MLQRFVQLTARPAGPQLLQLAALAEEESSLAEYATQVGLARQGAAPVDDEASASAATAASPVSGDSEQIPNEYTVAEEEAGEGAGEGEGAGRWEGGVGGEGSPAQGYGAGQRPAELMSPLEFIGTVEEGGAIGRGQVGTTPRGRRDSEGVGRAVRGDGGVASPPFAGYAHRKRARLWTEYGDGWRGAREGVPRGVTGQKAGGATQAHGRPPGCTERTTRPTLHHEAGEATQGHGRPPGRTESTTPKCRPSLQHEASTTPTCRPAAHTTRSVAPVTPRRRQPLHALQLGGAAARPEGQPIGRTEGQLIGGIEGQQPIGRTERGRQPIGRTECGRQPIGGTEQGRQPIGRIERRQMKSYGGNGPCTQATGEINHIIFLIIFATCKL